MRFHQGIFAPLRGDSPLTTIVSVRRHGKVVMGGDGQVSLGNTVMKGNAKKVRRLYHGQVLAGFAGATADAFTLFERFEGQLEKHQGHLVRAAVELAKEWRTDRSLSSAARTARSQSPIPSQPAPARPLIRLTQTEERDCSSRRRELKLN